MLKSFNDLKGQTLSSCVQRGEDELVFTLLNGEKYKLFHEQECCEEVIIEDICGDLSDLAGSEILMADQAISEKDPDGGRKTAAWTFYKLATIKGYVTIRFCGESNGYYSEQVDFKMVKE